MKTENESSEQQPLGQTHGSAPTAAPTTTKTLFSRETTVSINIKAKRSTIWAILTNAEDFARWNSTIVYIKGDIAVGKKIKLKSNLDLEREFTLQVAEMKTDEKMVWSDKKGPVFQGVRTYLLQDNPSGGVDFTMTERLGGIMAPMILRFIPDFDESFAQFAEDLKKEAEIRHKAEALLSSLQK